MANETLTLTIETEDASDELTVPAHLVELLREDDEDDARVIGDVTMMSLAQQIHGAVHHSHGEVDDDVQAVEEQTMELFEERFGRSFGDLTGHSH